MKTAAAILVALLLGAAGPRAQEPDSSLDSRNAEKRAGKNSPPRDARVADLERQIAEQDRTIRQLVENMAVLQSEAAMFQKELQEARLRRQIVETGMTDKDLQERLVEAVRNLYVSQRERRMAVERLQEMDKTLRQVLKTSQLPPEERARVEVELRLAGQLLASFQEEKERTPPVSDLNSLTVANVNPQLGLVILNAGRAQGVQVNMPFVVLRGDNVVGNVRIVEVRDGYSAAVIQRFKKGEEIRPGDRARIDARK